MATLRRLPLYLALRVARIGLVVLFCAPGSPLDLAEMEARRPGAR